MNSPIEKEKEIQLGAAKRHPFLKICLLFVESIQSACGIVCFQPRLDKWPPESTSTRLETGDFVLNFSLFFKITFPFLILCSLFLLLHVWPNLVSLQRDVHSLTAYVIHHFGTTATQAACLLYVQSPRCSPSFSFVLGTQRSAAGDRRNQDETIL